MFGTAILEGFGVGDLYIYKDDYGLVYHRNGETGCDVKTGRYTSIALDTLYKVPFKGVGNGATLFGYKETYQVRATYRVGGY